jgi:cytochrome c biogenesis protein CcmG, thiol:disulfide interchange protein DsbE
MWKYLAPLGGLIAICIVFVLGLNPNRDISEIPSPFIGKPAPAFILPSVFNPNEIVDNRRLIGRPYILNVWATWCTECRVEHETLLQISHENGIPIIGLNMKDEREKAVRWLNQEGNPYRQVAFDKKGEAALDWGVYGAPETFLIDSRGQVVFKFISGMTMQVWQKEFLPRIAADSRAK